MRAIAAASSSRSRETPELCRPAALEARHEREPSHDRLRAVAVVDAEAQPLPPRGDELVDRPVQDELALVDDRDVVGDLLDLVEEVRRDEHRAPVLLDEEADHLPEGRHAGRVEPVRRLVEDQELGIGEQAPGDAEALSHPHRVSLDLAVCVRGEPDALEGAVDVGVRVAAQEAGPYLEVAATGEVRIEPRLLDDASDAAERDVGLAGDAVPANVDRPARGAREAEHAPDERRLARAVRPEPAEAAAARHVDRDVAHRDLRAEALRHALEADDRLAVAHAGPDSSRSTASERRGHASFAQSPNGCVVSTAHATPRSGSTQRNVPLPPKCPYVARRGQLARPVPCLRSLELDAETPVERAEATEVGEHAVEPGELDARHLVVRLGSDETRREELAREREDVVERAVHAGPRMAARVEPEVERVGDRRLARSPRTASRRPRRRARRGRGSPRSSRCVDGPAARSALRPRTGARRRARAGGGRSRPAARPARRGRRRPPRPRRASRARRSAWRRTRAGRRASCRRGSRRDRRRSSRRPRRSGRPTRRPGAGPPPARY